MPGSEPALGILDALLMHVVGFLLELHKHAFDATLLTFSRNVPARS